MDIVEIEKRRMKERRKNYTSGSDSTDKTSATKSYVNFLITRILISIIIFFGAIILMNASTKFESFITEHVMKENISFSKIANIYNKYFGSIVPFESLIKDEATVFDEQMTYEQIAIFNDGYELTVEENYLVPILNSGIVVFIGEKEGLGNTIIIQGIDEIDYWYSNVQNLSCSLYDYVSKGDLLGTVDGTKLYLTFKKGTDYLDYDEVVG